MSPHARPPIVAFVAPSGTGKTTLLEGVIRALVARGRRVAVLKHDAHRLELDRPGKDTWRFRRAGAWRALIAGDEQVALFGAVDGGLSLGGLVGDWLGEADLVLTEGFRRMVLPGIRVHRAEGPQDPTWEAPGNLIAWASDVPVDTPLPLLPLNEPERVADFLEDRFLAPHAPREATLVLPVGHAEDLTHAVRMAARFGHLCGGRVLLVHAPDLRPGPALPAKADLRPETGPLGALLTALAAVDTPHVLLLGVRHAAAEPAWIEVLLAADPRADIAVARRGSYDEPLLAVYGHRCLAAIKGALLSGEPKMDGWWGQVRVARVPVP